jgi:DNA polymerase I-like protein with 3'-5' exonuclease and polymerase domains
MMLLALVILHNIMDPNEARIVGTVHDAILFEIKDEFVDKWVPIIKQTMENLPLKEKFDVTLTVPIKVDITIGTHWGEGKAI